MKTLFLPGVMIAVLGLAVASLSAQTQSTTVQLSKLVGAKVKSSQGEEVGVIKDVMINRNTGCVTYTVLSTSGAGAHGGKLVAAPWGVYSPTADVSALTVTVDRDRIYNAPVFDYSRIDEYSGSDYISRVDSYYGVSQGAAAGAAVSGATTTTGEAARAGAISGPGTTASPGATRSPAATRSPRATPSRGRSASPQKTPRATPGGRPQASPRAHRGAAETPSTREETRGERGRPEETPAAERGETGSRSELERSPSEERSPGERTSEERNPSERTTAPHHRERGTHETGTPSEGPGGEE